MINNWIVVKEASIVSPGRYRKKNYAAPFLDFLPA